jgi:hypothetical protein
MKKKQDLGKPPTLMEVRLHENIYVSLFRKHDCCAAADAKQDKYAKL